MDIFDYNLGYFLKLEHIEKGYLLLKRQIGEKAYNFKCIDLEIYRKEEKIKNFNLREYYNLYIQKDLFYNYPSTFYNSNYSIPKGAYGLRNFNYTSFNLQILYYSLGFYFLDLILDPYSEISNIKTNAHLYTFYGGRLNFKNPEKSKIFYQEDYDKFSKGIKKFIKDNLNDYKIAAIKLDIQNFYGEIDHHIFLESIGSICLPSHKNRLSYDSHTKSSLKDLFYFFMGSNKGLPLSHQNIISNFISDLFLFELDNFIQSLDITTKYKFSYFRYVDDFYILFCLNNELSNESIGDIIFDTGNRISNFLLNTLNLRCNPLKSQKYILKDENDFLKFVNDAKFISFNDPTFEQNAEKPKEKLDQIIHIITCLKEENNRVGISSLKTGDENILKECFIKAVKNYIQSDDAQNKIEEAFKDWNPILTLHSIKALMFLIGSNKNCLNQIEIYLKSNFEENVERTEILYLLEKFILHEKYSGQLNELILNINPPPSYYYTLITRLIKPHKEYNIKHIPISDEELVKYDSIMQQIKKIILSEKLNDFTLSFNHLLNTFHIFCFIKDNRNISQKKYDSKCVINFLKNKLFIKELHFVMSFFDRRNKNPISHAGLEKMENWIISKAEYEKYKQTTLSLIKKLFPLT